MSRHSRRLSVALLLMAALVACDRITGPKAQPKQPAQGPRVELDSVHTRRDSVTGKVDTTAKFYHVVFC